MKTTKMTLIAGLAVAATATLATGTTVAAASDVDASSGDVPAERIERIERACERVPAAQQRVDRWLTWIESDADSIGSLAWLDEQIEVAIDAGNDQRADWLTGRREVRAAAVPFLEARADQLDGFAEMCSDAGFGQ